MVRSTISTWQPARLALERVGVADQRRLVAAGLSAPTTPEPNSRSGTKTTARPGYWARSRANSWRTDSVRPHIWVTSTRPVRTLADGQLALDPGLVQQLQRRVDGRHGGGVSEAVGDDQPPVPVMLGVGLGLP